MSQSGHQSRPLPLVFIVSISNRENAAVDKAMETVKLCCMTLTTGPGTTFHSFKVQEDINEYCLTPIPRYIGTPTYWALHSLSLFVIICFLTPTRSYLGNLIEWALYLLSLFVCSSQFFFVFCFKHFCTFLWVCFSKYQYLWVCLGIYGHLWVCMGMYWYWFVWVCLSIFGYVWVHMGM